MFLATATSLLLTSCALPPGKPVSRYQPGDWQSLPGWPGDNLLASYAAWKSGCLKLEKNPAWESVCKTAPAENSSNDTIRRFLENNLIPVQLINADGTQTGLITGYYEPVYPGSLNRTAQAQYPLYARPKDLITVELGSLYPELKGKRVRGKLHGQKLTPYPDRAEISSKGVKAPVLAWLTDPMDVQFMQIQGSGRIKLENSQELRLGYADQNGHPYLPIGRWLVQQGELQPGEVTMQSIRQWAKANPERIEDLLNSNPSYVFFRALPSSQGGPIGSLGLPLTSGRSVAVDPGFVPLGSPLYLVSSRPDDNTPLLRMVSAQDTGGAIRGSVRADFFWGTGQEAGELAGKTKQQGKLWLLWPKDKPLPKQTN